MVKIAPDKSLPQTKNRGQWLTLTFEALIDAIPAVAGKRGRPRRRPDKLHADKTYRPPSLSGCLPETEHPAAHRPPRY